MHNRKQATAENRKNLEMLWVSMSKAHWLKDALDNIPLNVVTTNQGKQSIKPTNNPKLTPIKEKVKSFAEDIKSLPIELPYFDDDIACSESTMLDLIDSGLYNVAGLCYNNAVLTIYEEIRSNYSEHMASFALRDASRIYDGINSDEL